MKLSKSLKNLPKDSIFSSMDSPVGQLTLVACDQGLVCVLWDVWEKEIQIFLEDVRNNEKNFVLTKAKQQLSEYFAGKRQIFDLPLFTVGSDFQKQAWAELSRIPYGQTISYGEQAHRLGDIKKARAVGMANAMNPHSIIVPCHRVVGKNGALTGFGGGLDKKRKLLALESRFEGV